MTLKIERIELREILLPLKAPFEISSGIMKERHIFLLQLFDVHVVSGWGACLAGKPLNCFIINLALA